MNELGVIWLTIKLATVTTAWLLVLGTPLAWWLANGHSRWRTAVEAVVALPLILPPTVLGFYLLIAFAPDSSLGQLWQQLTGSRLAFSFSALVIGSVLYSMPFVVQPLQAAFRQLDRGLLEAAAVLGAPARDRWLTIILPSCRHSFITAASLGFAHTVGEFGVVLMIGGNIPGETQVLSIALFDRVESLQFAQAHALAAGLMAFSFVMLYLLYRRGDGNWRLQS
ncbi:molybdate ABC transporter permease subunit [Halieaceae bacterium IMCC14734]|uniref:Molybdenum transport system permease n=1 Tax=Candidatus Litorirhabdus singularis TaxID=2518993 RepID=A0ABT3TBT7_9GAMM|nr:molybdate ABC transporter permease subunit [Candidatus Litorirhabdus singularis]MCX2979763.1 molybdate ABC transporter permease subunit [Candidatus Litorirhabdus singularis]